MQPNRKLIFLFWGTFWILESLITGTASGYYHLALLNEGVQFPAKIATAFLSVHWLNQSHRPAAYGKAFAKIGVALLIATTINRTLFFVITFPFYPPNAPYQPFNAIGIFSFFTDVAFAVFLWVLLHLLYKTYRAEHPKNETQQDKRPAQAESQLPLNPQRPFRFLRTNRMNVKVYFDEILYVESLRDYVRVVTPDQNLLVQTQLYEMEADLPTEGFLRIHRSFLVAKDKIRAYNTDEVIIGEKNLPIGRTYKDLVLKVLEAG